MFISFSISCFTAAFTTRNARHQLERDQANKDHSINIDHTCHNLMNTSRAINLHGGIEKVNYFPKWTFLI